MVDFLNYIRSEEFQHIGWFELENKLEKYFNKEFIKEFRDWNNLKPGMDVIYISWYRYDAENINLTLGKLYTVIEIIIDTTSERRRRRPRLLVRNDKGIMTDYNRHNFIMIPKIILRNEKLKKIKEKLNR